jgi:hypothetical protein
MAIFGSNSILASTPRFRILVNGFADPAWFPTLHDAVAFIPTKSVQGLSFEIYDASERRYVWTRPRDNGNAIEHMFCRLKDSGPVVTRHDRTPPTFSLRSASPQPSAIRCGSGPKENAENAA